MPASFGSKLSAAFASKGQLCVGIDPHPALLEDWGLPDSPAGLESFAFRVLDDVAGEVGIIKPQVAFFERFGSTGFKVLEELCERASQYKLLNIIDAKRGDIGTTMDGYFEAWLGKGAPFLCDALTVSPYLGFQSLSATISKSAELGKGLFVLAATSNPEGAELQKARTAQDQTVAASILGGLNSVNQVTAGPADSLGSFGAVVGATLNLKTFGLDELISAGGVKTPILSPGFGAQGARLVDAGRLFGDASEQLIANVSRSVLAHNNVAELVSQAKAELHEGLQS